MEAYTVSLKKCDFVKTTIKSNQFIFIPRINVTSTIVQEKNSDLNLIHFPIICTVTQV